MGYGCKVICDSVSPGDAWVALQKPHQLAMNERVCVCGAHAKGPENGPDGRYTGSDDECPVPLPCRCDGCIARAGAPAAPPPHEEKVDHPRHYNLSLSGVEAIEVLEWMSFNLGTAAKYLWRQGLKPDVDAIEDLKKSIWYIQREIGRLERMAIGDARSLHEKRSQKVARGKPFQACDMAGPFNAKCTRPRGHDGDHEEGGPIRGRSDGSFTRWANDSRS
jgi:hypothetical protein